MVTPADQSTAETTRDPVMDRLRARLRTMMLIAFGTLGLGLFAVIVALVVRINRTDSAAPFDSRVDIMTPGTVVETGLDGDRLMLTIDGSEGKVLEIHELSTGRLVGRVRLIGK